MDDRKPRRFGGGAETHQRANSPGWCGNWAKDHAGRPRPDATEARGSDQHPDRARLLTARCEPGRPPGGRVRQVWAVGRGAHCCAGGRMQRDIGDQGEKALDVSAVLPMMRRGEVQPPRWWYPVGRRVVPLTLRHFELHQFDPRALSSSTTSSRPWCRASRRTTSVLDGRPSPCATTPSFPMKGWLPHHRAIGAAVLPQHLQTQHALPLLTS